jgi:hypothetical protein
MKTPTWKATQNQILVDTAQTVPFSTAARNAKAPLQFLLMLLIVILIFPVGQASLEDQE